MRGRAAPAVLLVVVLVAALMLIAMAALASPARAADEDVRPCEPPCAEGAICLNGTCMVPAQPATATADAVAADPPAYPEHASPPPANPPPTTTPRAPRSSGFQPMLYAGAHALSGAGTGGTDPGLRLGAIL